MDEGSFLGTRLGGLASGAQASQVLSCPAGKFANISQGPISATLVRFTAVCATVAP